MTTVDYARFVELVRDALAKLHDPNLLEGHPLCALLAPAERPLGVGELQRTLIDSVRQPLAGAAPGHKVQQRPYRYLWLRYVDGLDLGEISTRLGIAERQARRDHREGLEAVAHALWSRHRGAQWAADPLGGTVHPADAGALGAEIRKLGAELPPGPTSLVDTLAEVYATTSGLIASSGLRLRFDVPADLAPVAINRVFLRQILMSVLLHLATRVPGGEVVVAAEPADAEVSLKVVAQPRAPAGARADPSPPRLADATADEEPLELAARLAETLGGGCAVSSDEAGRQLIRVRFPSAYVATVLVIDDNADFLRLFARCLEGSAYRVLTASEADEALRLAREVRPDVVVIDVLVPTQDGWELLASLRQDPATGGIPVVVCSVLRESRLALGLGATDFLPKPITPLALRATLERARARRAAGEGSPGSGRGPRPR